MEKLFICEHYSEYCGIPKCRFVAVCGRSLCCDYGLFGKYRLCNGSIVLCDY